MGFEEGVEVDEEVGFVGGFGEDFSFGMGEGGFGEKFEKIKKNIKKNKKTQHPTRDSNPEPLD